jgi:hypothetical protein
MLKRLEVMHAMRRVEEYGLREFWAKFAEYSVLTFCGINRRVDVTQCHDNRSIP